MMETMAARRPEMLDFKIHNSLIGDRAALNDAWETEGYWYFKDVLDKDAVARMRKVYTDELEKLKIVDPVNDATSAKSVEYNGASLDDFPPRMDRVWHNHVWKTLTSAPQVNAFFTQLLGDKPIWVPIVEYRATPPAPPSTQQEGSWATGIHQDGPYSPGIPFRICWVPLASIDREIGGLALVEGMAAKVNHHPMVNGTPKFIPQENVPSDKWRTAGYEAGDVLLINPWTPHTGLHNFSLRFRLSMDLTVMVEDDGAPVIGTLKDISTEQVVLVDNEGLETSLRLVDETFVRNTGGVRIFGPDILSYYSPGVSVIVAHTGDRATVIRPQHG